jgi:hypothetical protein
MVPYEIRGFRYRSRHVRRGSEEAHYYEDSVMTKMEIGRFLKYLAEGDSTVESFVVMHKNEVAYR